MIHVGVSSLVSGSTKKFLKDPFFLSTWMDSIDTRDIVKFLFRVEKVPFSLITMSSSLYLD